MLLPWLGPVDDEQELYNFFKDFERFCDKQIWEFKLGNPRYFGERTKRGESRKVRCFTFYGYYYKSLRVGSLYYPFMTQ